MQHQADIDCASAFQATEKSFCGLVSLLALMMILIVSACSENPAPSLVDQREHIRAMIDQGNIKDGLQLASLLARNNPDDPETMRIYGHALVLNGQGAVAEGILLRAADLGVGQHELLLDMAKAMILQGKYRQALRLLEESAENSDAGPAVLALTGEAQLGATSYDQERIFQTFLRLYKTLSDEPAGTGQIDQIRTWLDGKRADQPVVEAAFQHFTCPNLPVVAVSETDKRDNVVAPEVRILKVGPSRRLKVPSDAAREARDGDIIEIDAGIYEGDVASWTQNNLVLRGVGGLAHMKSNGATAQDKGIWFFAGNNNTVEYIEFSGARSKDRNGSGIRLHGSGLTVRHSSFHDNEDGILGGYGEDSEVLVEYSEFARNGYGDGQSHNIYIGQIGTFTLRYSYSHHVKVGHLVKSRARNNFILYNRLLDEADGTSSYVIDIPEGGSAYIIGNELHKGPQAENAMIISFGAEKQDRDIHNLYVIHNTFHNQYPTTIFVKNYTDADSELINNIFAGATGVILQGAGHNEGFVSGGFLGLTDPQTYDYSLTRDSPAIDAGVPIPTLDHIDLNPGAEYVHSTDAHKRRNVWTPDLGAHEFCGL